MQTKYTYKFIENKFPNFQQNNESEYQYLSLEILERSSVS